jgi:hypothetical protein
LSGRGSSALRQTIWPFLLDKLGIEVFTVFESNQKPTGTQYTGTVALLAIAFIFSPVAVLISHPLEYPSLLGATTVSVLCVVLARINWQRNSKLTIPSLETSQARSK